MNWPQLHTSATPEERDEITVILLHRLHARRHRRVFYRGRFIPERRAPQRTHSLHDRRRAYLPRLVLEPASSHNTPRVIRTGIIGALIVSLSALVTSPVSPGVIYTIPGYLLFALAVFALRQTRLYTA